MDIERKRPGIAFWSTVLLVVVMLYVLSSGPTRLAAVRARPAYFGTGRGPAPMLELHISRWWVTVYRPIFWASEHSWGKPFRWYWSLFPIRDA